MLMRELMEPHMAPFEEGGPGAVLMSILSGPYFNEVNEPRQLG